MIKAHYFTVVIRKDALEAKWPGGLAGYKQSRGFDEEAHQEDEDLIVDGTSMGSDLHFFLNGLVRQGLVYQEKREIVRRHHTLCSLIARCLMSRESALSRFGREQRVGRQCEVDFAVVTGGGPGVECDWLESVPGAARNCIRFKHA